MSIKRKAINRAGSLLAAVAVALGALVPAIVPHVGAAPQQVQTRSIQLSDSTPGKTGVTYSFKFTTQQANADSMVVDFCNDGSIIGATCTSPTGFSAATVTTTSITGLTGWSVDTTPSFIGARTNVLALKDGSGPTNKIPATTTVSFDITGFTNPTADAAANPAGTFWARVYTYADSSYGNTVGTKYASATSLGTYLDYGGFALSTATLINITATVMETLTFCVDHATIATSCSGITTPVQLTLGHGTPKVLGTTAADTAPAYFQVSTNALTGAVIKMKTHNTCSGLSRDGGTSCPIPGSGSTPDFFTTINTKEFGVNVAADSPLGTTLGTLTPQAPYSTASKYAMDNTTTGNQVTTGGGTELATTTGVASADLGGVLTFAAQADATTPAGVYTADESLIATGTF